MSDFKGFTCDVCNEVWSDDVKTRETVTFSGFKALSGFYRELCPSCVKSPAGFMPVKTRTRKRTKE